MSFFRNLSRGIRGLFRKEGVEREMDEELRGYLDAASEEQMKDGMSRTEAMRAARAHMGSVESVKEGIRTATWESALESLWRDLMHGFRVLAKRPGFTAMAILTLGLGIGANSAIFSFIDAWIIKSLPYPEPPDGSSWPQHQDRQYLGSSQFDRGFRRFSKTEHQISEHSCLDRLEV